jgi:hypothetical protein
VFTFSGEAGNTTGMLFATEESANGYPLVERPSQDAERKIIATGQTMRISLIFRLFITVLRYPAPAFCEHWGYWTQPNRFTKTEAKWLWRADIR